MDATTVATMPCGATRPLDEVRRETSAEARPCRHAGDVRHPELVRLIGPEIPVDKIVGWPDPAVPDRGTRAFSAAYACQSRCLHQPFDTLAANVDTLISQLVITQPPNFKRCGPWRFGLRSGQAADDRGEGVEPVPEGELLLAMDGVERVINIEGRPKGVVYSHAGATGCRTRAGAGPRVAQLAAATRDPWEMTRSRLVGARGGGRPSRRRGRGARRMDQRGQQRGDVGNAAPSCLSVDAAAVSLQRQVLSLDDHHAGRDPCVPACAPGGSDL